jgi:SAM-dependent methyltransferase
MGTNLPGRLPMKASPMMTHSHIWSLSEVAAYWDSVADRYLELFRDELAGKPYDMEMLRGFAAGLSPGSLVCDAGCGPCGHVSRFLSDLGMKVVGVDVSPRCVALARKEQPHIRFEVMDLGSVTFKDSSIDGIIAYYSLHYEPAAILTGVVQEFFRVLRPGGKILLVAKQGEGEDWVPDPLGSGQKVFWKGFQAEELTALLCSCPFQIESVDIREPLPEEIAVRRIYVSGKRC